MKQRQATAPCQYPACKVTFSVTNPIGLCQKHREMAAFIMWFLEKKLRLGEGGPTVIEVLVAAMSALTKDAEPAKSILVSPTGRKLM